MDVGAVGGLGGAGMAAGAMGAAGAAAAGAAGAGATGAAGALAVGRSASTAASCGSSTAASPSAGMTQQMQDLAELIKGFSSAEILIALMMNKSDKGKEAGGAALGMLAGMALANQLQHGGVVQKLGIGGCNPADVGNGGNFGGSLNVTL